MYELHNHITQLHPENEYRQLYKSLSVREKSFVNKLYTKYSEELKDGYSKETFLISCLGYVSDFKVFYCERTIKFITNAFDEVFDGIKVDDVSTRISKFDKLFREWESENGQER